MEYTKKMAERLFKLTCPYDKSVVTVHVLEKFITQIISDVRGAGRQKKEDKKRMFKWEM